MARPKDIGTAAETAVVRYLQANGWPAAERRALRGSKDCGDVAGLPGVVVEVKGGAAAKTASDGQIAAWLAETENERQNAGAQHGVLVVQRAGVGPANAGRWWAYIPVRTLVRLVTVHAGPERYDMQPVRMLLGDLVQLLHHAGYGTAPTTSADAPTAPPARDSAAVTVANH